MKKTFSFSAIFLTVTCCASAALAQAPPQFILEWGEYGSEPGQFLSPRGITFDATGNVYVADTFNHRVQKFDNTGMFLTQWGSEGSGEGQFFRPESIALDPRGKVYVGDGRGRLQKFTSDGVFLNEWDGYGRSLAVDENGYLFVVSGNYVLKYQIDGTLVAQWGGRGWGDGMFVFAGGIAVDRDGNVFVTDRDDNKIQKFDNNGKFLTSWDAGTDPIEVSVDFSGNVYVIEHIGNGVSMFSSDGELLSKWGAFGKGIGEFSFPYDVTVDASGNIYVVEDYRVQKFSFEPTPVQPVTWGRIKGMYKTEAK